MTEGLGGPRRRSSPWPQRPSPWIRPFLSSRPGCYASVFVRRRSLGAGSALASVGEIVGDTWEEFRPRAGGQVGRAVGKQPGELGWEGASCEVLGDGRSHDSRKRLPFTSSKDGNRAQERPRQPDACFPLPAWLGERGKSLTATYPLIRGRPQTGRQVGGFGNPPHW